MKKGQKRKLADDLALLHESSEFRSKVFKELKQHIVAGYSLDCYEFLSKKLIMELVNKYPQEFDINELDSSMRAGQKGWENIGRRQAEGTCLGNSRAWAFNMAARYGWSDKQEVKVDHAGQVAVNIVSYSDNIPSSNKQ